MKSWMLLLLALATTGWAQLQSPHTRDDVISQFGMPKSVSIVGEREVLNYPDFTVLLVGGKVVGLRVKPKTPENRMPQLRPKLAPVPAEAAPPAPEPRREEIVVPFRAPERVAPRPAAVQPRERKAPLVAPVNPTQVLINTFTRVLLYFTAAVVVLGLLVFGFKKLARSHGYSRHRDPFDALLEKPSNVPPPHRRPDAIKDGWTLPLLREIEWHGFERLTAEYYRALGHRAELTDFGPDGGVDVEVFEGTAGAPSLLVQCKAFDEELVGVKLVRELYGVAAARNVVSTAFFTTSDFTADAQAFGQSVKMDLVSGDEFLRRLQALPLSASWSLFENATAGDYRTPTCPSCGIKMIQRSTAAGRSAGSPFWGCVNYPRCRQTLHCARS